MNPDEQHLNLLAVFHYVLGAIVAMFACLPIIHLVMGIVLLSVPFSAQGPNGPPPMFIRAMGGFMIVIACFLIMTGWALAACLVYAGRCLSKRRNRTLCLVVAACGCLFMPFGTILGVFTIVVLMRPSVQAMFEGGTPISA